MKHFISYVPHGINPNKFKPLEIIDSKTEIDPEYLRFKSDVTKGKDYDFIVFYNSRNIRRKQPADVMLGFSYFCQQNPTVNALLIMKTHVQDPNGTDLMAVKDNLFPKLNVIFIEDNLPDVVMNYLYNMADVTVSMSSAEGFGLSIAESIMAGTMVIAPVHGGLQDQMNFSGAEFDDEVGVGSWIPSPELPSNSRKALPNCGKWCIPMFPVARQLQGSIQTPYIFDYVVDATQLGTALTEVNNIGYTERCYNGLAGRAWMMSQASGMNTEHMAFNFKRSVNALFERWEKKPNYTIEKINYNLPTPKHNGLLK